MGLGARGSTGPEWSRGSEGAGARVRAGGSRIRVRDRGGVVGQGARVRAGEEGGQSGGRGSRGAGP